MSHVIASAWAGASRHPRSLLRWLACLLGGFLVAGCGSNSPQTPPPDAFEVRKLPDALAPDAGRIAEANNRFALDLYTRLGAESGNLFYSPFSIATALEMTLAGAHGVTDEEMRRVLHLDLPADQLHPASGALVKSLDRGIALGGYRLSVANRLWGQSGYTFLEPFLATARDDYGAGLEPLDFQNAAEDARGTINAWVEEKTEGRIEDLMPEGSVNDLTRLVLTNAIYFKGDWARPFDPRRTQDRPFHVATGTDVNVPLMTQEGEFRVAFLDGFAALELPYAGNDLSMLVLVPHAIDGLGALEQRLTIENLTEWIARLDTGHVEVSLPRFTTSSSFSLGETLAAMGMPSAFDPSSADFSGINGNRDLSISAVVHKGFVAVNEEGTEAAAATGVSVGVTSVPPSIVADHPFLFMIRDHVTGSILFVGRLVDPRS